MAVPSQVQVASTSAVHWLSRRFVMMAWIVPSSEVSSCMLRCAVGNDIHLAVQKIAYRIKQIISLCKVAPPDNQHFAIGNEHFAVHPVNDGSKFQKIHDIKHFRAHTMFLQIVKIGSRQAIVKIIYQQLDGDSTFCGFVISICKVARPIASFLRAYVEIRTSLRAWWMMSKRHCRASRSLLKIR